MAEEILEAVDVEENDVKESKKSKKSDKKKVDFDKVLDFIETFLPTDIERSLELAELRKELKADKGNKKLQESVDNFEIWTEELWAKHDELNPAEQKIAEEFSDAIEKIIERLSHAKLSNDQIREALAIIGEIASEE